MSTRVDIGSVIEHSHRRDIGDQTAHGATLRDRDRAFADRERGDGLAEAHRQAARRARRVPQRHTVRSSPALAIVAPSGLNATALTQLVWPSSTRPATPLAASHNRTVWSSPALAIVAPSGLNATARTAPVWPCSTRPA
jgi:hypothetical protein